MHVKHWEVVNTDNDEVHVMPHMSEPCKPEHETSAHCFCRPVVESYRRTLYIHNAFEN